MSGTISSQILKALALGAGELGLDVGRVFGLCGIPLEVLEDPSTRLPASAELAVWDAIVAATDDPLVGLRMSDVMRPGAFGAVEYLALSSATCRDAVTHFLHHQRLLDDLADSRLTDYGERSAIRIARVRDYPLSPQGVECMIATTLSNIRALWPAASEHVVRLAHAPLGGLGEYTSRLRCEVRFDQDCYEIIFPTRYLDAHNGRADPRLHEVLRLHVDDLVRAVPEYDPFLARAHRRLSELLLSPSFSLEALANSLGVSGRTLRRRMAEAGTSYRSLLDEVRKPIALRAISNTNATFDEISDRLGYVDRGTFFRAVKRWTGMTPGQFRVQHNLH